MNFNPVLHRLRRQGLSAAVENLEGEVEELNAKKRKARGVTLVEVMMVLGVMAFLLGLVMLVAALVNGTNKSNQFIEEITTLVDVTNQLTQGQNDLSGLSEADLAKSGLIPTRWTDGSTQLFSPFGSQITVKGSAAGQGTDNLTTYTITAQNIPQTACVKIAVVDFGNALVARTIQGQSGGSGGSGSSSGTSGTGSPFTAQAAVNACTGNQIPLTFEFARD